MRRGPAEHNKRRVAVIGGDSRLMLNHERGHVRSEPLYPADYATVLSDLQGSSRCGDLVLSLRSEHRLHPVVEWHLEHLLHGHHDGQMHVQAEKNGISNGRIDLVAYGGTRSVIHFELIASNSGGHVFRDTTSLLGSKADARLAVLIDEDLDPDVCKNYKRAIPLPTIIEDVPLGMVLLKRNEAVFNDLLRRLLGRAAFRSGSLRLEGFRCELDSYELQPQRSFFATETRQQGPACVFACVPLMIS